MTVSLRGGDRVDALADTLVVDLNVAHTVALAAAREAIALRILPHPPPQGAGLGTGDAVSYLLASRKRMLDRRALVGYRPEAVSF